MADGFLVEVTPPTSGGQSEATMWYAHIPDKDKALSEVRKVAEAPDGSTLKVVKPLTHLILASQSVPEGGVLPFE
jgi:hypothetical protein